MWRTPDGERVMQGPELKLFSAAADALRNRIIESRGRIRTGVRFFDESLEREEQLAAIQFAVDNLSDPESKCPHLTAWVEATVYAVFMTALREIHREIRKQGPSHHWRALVYDACLASYGDEVDDEEDEDGQNDEDDVLVSGVHCRAIDSWSFAINLLADSILWDRDWEMSEDFLDLPPEFSQHLKMRMGIDDDYFVEVPLARAQKYRP